MSKQQQYRRSLLALVPTIATGLAGCMSGASDEPTPPSTTNDSTEAEDTAGKYEDYDHVETLVDETMYVSIGRETVPVKLKSGDLLEIKTEILRGFNGSVIVADPNRELLDRVQFEYELDRTIDIETDGVHRLMFKGPDRMDVTVDHYRP